MVLTVPDERGPVGGSFLSVCCIAGSDAYLKSTIRPWKVISFSFLALAASAGFLKARKPFPDGFPSYFNFIGIELYSLQQFDAYDFSVG